MLWEQGGRGGRRGGTGRGGVGVRHTPTGTGERGACIGHPRRRARCTPICTAGSGNDPCRTTTTAIVVCRARQGVRRAAAGGYGRRRGAAWRFVHQLEQVAGSATGAASIVVDPESCPWV